MRFYNFFWNKYSQVLLDRNRWESLTSMKLQYRKIKPRNGFNNQSLDLPTSQLMSILTNQAQSEKSKSNSQ